MIAPNANGANRANLSTVRGLRRLVRRNGWLFVVIPILTLAATAVFIAVATPVYDGMATLRIDKQRSSLAVLDALQELSTGSEIATEMLELKGRTLAEQVVDQLDLHVDLEEPARASRAAIFAQFEASRAARAGGIKLTRRGPSEFELQAGDQRRTVRVGERVQLPGLMFALAPAAAQHEAIELRVRRFPLAVRQFRDKLGIARPEREASMVTIRYESKDRALASAVPNQVANQFIARRDSVRKTQARSTVVFLRDQISALGAELTQVEAGLQSFRERQGVISPEVEGETQITKLADMQAQRDVTESERQSLAAMIAEIENSNDRTGSAYGRLIGFPALLRNPAASELLRSRNEAESRRAELLKRSTEADPEVVIETQRIQQLDGQLRALAGTYLKGLTDQVRSLDAVLSRYAGQLARIPAQEMGLARLRRQAKVSEEIYTELQTRLGEAEIAAAVEDPSVRVVDPADLPIRPIFPNIPLSFTLAILLGLALSAGVAFVRENLDTSIRDREQLQELSGAVPVLGTVPRIGANVPTRRVSFWPLTPRNGVHAPASGPIEIQLQGAVAEAYRTLRTNIAFTNSERVAQVLLVSSALPSEGKSTSARNLAVALAHQGGRVALIDADMRRGLLHESLHAQQEPGLSNVLLGTVAAADALQSIKLGTASIDFMGTGTVPPNPAELLGSARFSRLVDELRSQYTAVIIDTPPLNLVTDAAIAGARVDGVLMVARAGVTDRGAFRHALEQLEAVRARVVGVVLNDVDVHVDAYYGSKGAAGYYAPHARR